MLKEMNSIQGVSAGDSSPIGLASYAFNAAFTGCPAVVKFFQASQF